MMPHSQIIPTPASVAALVRHAAEQLSGGDARREAEMLLEHVLEVSRAWLFTHPDVTPEADAARAYVALVERRAQGEPLAYIVGHIGFWTLNLKVTPDTLIPRPETELLVEAALEKLPLGTVLQLADLGTGSGAIALALASERPLAQVIATDASSMALKVARENAQRNALANVRFREGDWFAPLRGERFHLIASNPPYVAEGDPHLDLGDLRYEPSLALSCGVDGLDAIRTLAEQAPAHLLPDGWLLIEHGLDQGRAVRALLQATGFVDVSTRSDLEQRDRVTLGRFPA